MFSRQSANSSFLGWPFSAGVPFFFHFIPPSIIGFLRLIGTIPIPKILPVVWCCFRLTTLSTLVGCFPCLVFFNHSTFFLHLLYLFTITGCRLWYLQRRWLNFQKRSRKRCLVNQWCLSCSIKWTRHPILYRHLYLEYLALRYSSVLRRLRTSHSDFRHTSCIGRQDESKLWSNGLAHESYWSSQSCRNRFRSRGCKGWSGDFNTL